MLRYVLAAAIAALPLATPAWAEQSRSIAVRTDDLNLTTTEGKTELAERVARAARRICPVAGPNTREYVEMRACERAALASSAPSTAYAEKRQGERRMVIAAAQVAPVSARAADR